MNRDFQEKNHEKQGDFYFSDYIWIVISLFWFWAENIALGTIWLCAGFIELFIALVRRSKEKKSK
jgi:hypothetical protein